MLILRSLVATALLPGTVTIVIPWLILRAGRPAAVHWSGLLPVVLGAAVLVRCIRDFAVVGRGTLAPVDAPTRLVVSGLYRYVRNPMYVGVVLMLAGEAWGFSSAALAFYAAGFLVVANLFVVFHEEPALLRTFGAPYRDYMRQVPRWIPTFRGRQPQD